MVIRIVTLRVGLMQYEVAICHTVHAHVHDRLVTHADSHTSIASTRSVALDRQSVARVVSTCLALLAVFASVLASCPIIFIVFWVAPRALRALMLQALFRTVKLGLFIWFKCGSTLVAMIRVLPDKLCLVTHVDFGGSQADHSNLLLATTTAFAWATPVLVYVLGVMKNLLALAALDLRILNLVFLLFLKLARLVLALHVDCSGNLSFIAVLALTWAATKALLMSFHLDYCELAAFSFAG